jgi:hypothetical protein
MPYGARADLVLVAHILYVLGVIVPVPLIVYGRDRWRWTRNFTLRVIHVAMIGFVAAQSLLGAWCPLTLLESHWRAQSGESRYTRGFIAEYVSRALYWDLPGWVFGAVYIAFAGLVLWLWRKIPPRRAHS